MAKLSPQAQNQADICRRFAVPPRAIGILDLPRRTRLRLWLARRIDLTATWLADHGHRQR